MLRDLKAKKYLPESEETLLRAFEALDTDKKGYFTKEELTKFMQEEGEKFSSDEMEEMFSAFLDQEKNVAYSADMAMLMVVEKEPY